jgi:hypothetical protein
MQLVDLLRPGGPQAGFMYLVKVKVDSLSRDSCLASFRPTHCPIWAGVKLETAISINIVFNV